MPKRAAFFLLLTLTLFSALGFSILHSKTIQAANCTSTDSGQPIRVSNGLLSAVNPDSIASYLINNPTPTPYCISGAPAAIPQFALQSYKDLKSLYYDQANPNSRSYIIQPELTGDRTQNDIQFNGGKSSIYHVKGNLTLSGRPGGNQSGLIFVDGNLIINPPTNGSGKKVLDYPPSPNKADSAGLLFIVQGDIDIYFDAAQVDAFMVTYGNFCDTYNGTSCLPGDSTSPLTINGSVIAINPPIPTPSPQPPQFNRKYNNIGQAAETINYQGKYLVLFKDMLAKDLYIWQEIQ